jgi:hypothetical protein
VSGTNYQTTKRNSANLLLLPGRYYSPLSDFSLLVVLPFLYLNNLVLDLIDPWNPTPSTTPGAPKSTESTDPTIRSMIDEF